MDYGTTRSLHSVAPAAGAPESLGAPPVRRVVVIDDHELLRAGTRRILDDASGFTVVGEADDGEAAVRVVEETEPDVVLVDIRLPSVNGIDLARRIVERHPGTTVLILSAYDDEHYVRAALSAGVAGYLLKTTPSDELVRSIRDACDGFSLGRGPSGWGRRRRRPTRPPAPSGSPPGSRRWCARSPGAGPTRPSPTNSASVPVPSKGTSTMCSRRWGRRRVRSWSTTLWPTALFVREPDERSEPRR